MTELRSAPAAVYAALGLPSPTYTDMGLAAGMSITAVHIVELRTAVRRIE